MAASRVFGHPGGRDLHEEFVRLKIRHRARRVAEGVFPFVPRRRAEVALGKYGRLHHRASDSDLNGSLIGQIGHPDIDPPTQRTGDGRHTRHDRKGTRHPVHPAIEIMVLEVGVVGAHPDLEQGSAVKISDLIGHSNRGSPTGDEVEARGPDEGMPVETGAPIGWPDCCIFGHDLNPVLHGGIVRWVDVSGEVPGGLPVPAGGHVRQIERSLRSGGGVRGGAGVHAVENRLLHVHDDPFEVEVIVTVLAL